jgi:uncharacterized protein YkwD
MKVKIILFISLFLLSCTNTQDKIIYTQHTYNFNQQELEVMQITNEYRASIGLNTLTSIQHIGFLCEEHNQYMITTHIISHDYFYYRSQNLESTTLANHVGEVIAYNYVSSNSALQAWLNSPGHKKIIEGNFTNFGVAILIIVNIIPLFLLKFD